ncbi:MAG TPA: hypothetical protein VGF55_15240 [Gemmataceae bacterium]|jgi:hypothetical protein
MTGVFRATLVVLFVSVPLARADGCKWFRDGRIVPEHEQRALIEWADGVETLYLAVRTDPTADASVWVVPVRATATAVGAEPIDEFPVVPYYLPLAARANRILQNVIDMTAVWDSGGLLCPVFMPGCHAETRPAAEESRVEKLGMVVTVVSAESRAAIEQYLDTQGVNRAAADLSSLDPYFGGGYAFVCGWVARRDGPVTATGLKVHFPSPTAWFPLRPTRAYTNRVRTVVFVRGLVKPAADCNLPELACQYVDGSVVPQGVLQAFAASAQDSLSYYYGFRNTERLTRVTLTTDPQQWDRDLELVPGTTPNGAAALAVIGAGGLVILASALLAAPVGLIIPWLTVAKADRHSVDWLAGVLIGAAIVFTIWASALLLAVWAGWLRFRGRRVRPYGTLALLLLAVLHFAVVFAVCRGLMAWIDTGA